MFRKLIILLSLMGCLVISDKAAAIPPNDNCSLFTGSGNAWRCQNRNWIYQYFRNLVNTNNSKYIPYILKKAGCNADVIHQPIDNLINQCQARLKTNFECAVTITIVEDLKVQDVDFYPHCSNIKKQ